MTHINHVEKDIGFDYFFKRSLERGNKMMRKFSDKSDRIGEKYLRGGREHCNSSGGVERCEEAVLNERSSIRQRVEKSRFPRVGVADERYIDKLFSSLPASFSLESDFLELLFKVRNALSNHSAVGLDLGLAGALCSYTAELFRQVSPLARETGKEVLELCKLHLCPCLV